MGIEGEDVLFFVVRVSEIGVAGNDGREDLAGIGLPEHFERHLRVDRRITHGEKETAARSEPLKNWRTSSMVLESWTIESSSKYPGENDDHHAVGGGKGIDRQPGECRGTVDNHMVILIPNRIQLILQSCLTVVNCQRERISVLESRMWEGTTREVFNACPMHG